MSARKSLCAFFLLILSILIEKGQEFAFEARPSPRVPDDSGCSGNAGFGGIGRSNQRRA